MRMDFVMRVYVIMMLLLYKVSDIADDLEELLSD